MQKSRRWFRLTWVLIAATLLAMAVPGGLALGQSSGTAAEVSSGWQSAVQQLMKFGIIRGDASGDVRAHASITRAEMAKILVAAAGREKEATGYGGEAPFGDVAGHWSVGYVAVAKASGWISGYPDGTFQPQKDVTYAEVITLLIRFVGLGSSAQQTPGAWPDNYIAAAGNVGIVDPSVNIGAAKNAPAVRGGVFVLADNAFQKVPVDDKSQNVYQKYLSAAEPGAAPPAPAPTTPKPPPPVLTVSDLPATTSETSVTIKGSSTGGGTLTVNGDTMVTSASGAFVTLVDLKPGRNEITVVAANAGGEARKVLVVEHVPVVINAPASLSVEAGSTVTLNVVAVDEGKEIKYGTSQSLRGGVDGQIGWLNAADGTFTGADTPGAKGKLLFGYKTAKAEIAVTIVQPAVAKVEVSPVAATVKIGTPQKFTAKALDSSGREITGLQPTWSTEPGKGIIDATGNFTATGIGAIRVTATMSGVSSHATASVAGPATKLVIAPIQDLVANGTGLQTVTVSAQDRDGNPASDFSGNITLAITGSQYAGFYSGGVLDAATTSQVKAASAGSASFTIIANKAAGSTVLQASSPNLTSATATLVSAAQVITSIDVSALPAKMAADNASASTITVKLLDQESQPFVGGDVSAWSAAFSSSNTGVATTTGAITGATANLTTGATIVATANAKSQVGTSDINVSVRQGGQEKFTGKATITTILIGEPVKIVAASTPSGTARQVGGSETMDLQVRLLDPNGNLVTRVNNFTGLVLTLTANDNLYTAVVSPGSATTRVEANIPGGGVTLTAANASVSGGVVTVRLASGKAQSVNFTVVGTYSGTNLEAATLKGTFNPGSAKTVTLASVKGTVSPGGGSDTLRASIRDDADLNTSANALTTKNLATTSALTVTFRRLTGSATNWVSDQIVTAQGGVAEVSVSVGATVGTDQFDARITVGTTVTSSPAQVRVAVMGAAHRVAFGTYPTPASPGRAGVSHTTTVLIKDGQATPETITTDNNSAVTLTLKDSSGATLGTYNATAAFGVATFEIPALSQSGTMTATATSGSLQSATVTDYTLSPGTGVKLIGTLGASSISAAADSTTTLTIWAADAGGNKLTDTLSGVSVTSSSLSVAGLSGSCSGNNCSYTVTATANPGNATLTATKSGLESFSITLTTVVTGEARDVQIVVDQGNTAGALGATGTTVRQRVRVVLKDGNGNRVTQTAGQKWVRLVAEGTGSDGTNTRISAGSPLTSTVATLKHWAQSTQGEATFYVNTSLAGTLTYTAIIVPANESDAQAAATNSGTGTGAFTAGAPYKVMVSTPNPSVIRGDGGSISSITAKVTDLYGNVTAATGTFRLTLSATTHVTFAEAGADGSFTASTATGSVTTVLMARQVTSGGSATVTATFTPSTPLSLPGGTSATSVTLTITQ